MDFKKKNKEKLNSGFTFVEIISVLAIMAILATVVTMSFSSVGGKQSLEKATISVISIFNEAKSMAISSKDFSDYGVRVESDKLTSFKGSYGNENTIYSLPNLVTISNISLGGSDVIFKRVSGSTTATGTITISLINDQSENNIIKISQTGLIEKI